MRVNPHSRKTVLTPKRPTLAADAGGRRQGPPGGLAAASGPPKKPTLTQTFNRAARGIVVRKSSQMVSKLGIEELRKKLSRPALTYDRTMFGNVVGCLDRDRDRKIMHQIKDATKQLLSKTGKSMRAFTKATLDSKAKRAFNRAADRRM